MRRVVMTAHVLLFPVLFALGVGCSGSVAPHETARDDPKPDREAAGVSARAPASPPRPVPPANERAAHTEDNGPDVAASSASFSFATYNINWGNVDLRAMVGTIRRADADVVCLQENTAPSERVIRETFAEHYPQIRFQGDRGRYAAEGFGILSRVPITKIRYLPPKHGLFGAYLAQVQLGGRTVQVVNVHLQPPMLQRGDGVLGTLKALADMEETQVREIVHLLERIRPDVPTILAGDLNSPSALRAPMLLKGKGYVDGFAQANKDPDSYATWHWPTRFGEVSLRIDYIFHTRDLRTLASEVIQSEASDHFLVVSRLAWSEESATDSSAARRQQGGNDQPGSR